MNLDAQQVQNQLRISAGSGRAAVTAQAMNQAGGMLGGGLSDPRPMSEVDGVLNAISREQSEQDSLVAELYKRLESVTLKSAAESGPQATAALPPSYGSKLANMLHGCERRVTATNDALCDILQSLAI